MISRLLRRAGGARNRVAKPGGLALPGLPCLPQQVEDTMNFRIRGLEAGQFAHLFGLSDAELAAHGAVRKIADGPRPCRISLTDATPGDEVILANFEHHAVAS